jgi:hypothetical protein
VSLLPTLGAAFIFSSQGGALRAREAFGEFVV